MKTQIFIMSVLMLLTISFVKAQKDGPQKNSDDSASTILVERQAQLIEYFKYWDSDLEKEILDNGIYKNKSKKKGNRELKDIIFNAGGITAIEPLVSESRLKGKFNMKGQKGKVRVLYSLSPEKPYKIEKLNVLYTGN